MLYNLLLASITILLCLFFLFFAVFKNFFTNAVATENAKLQLALIVPTGAPIAVANDELEMLSIATDKTMIYLNIQKKQCTCWDFCSELLRIFSLISVIKSLISLILFSLNCWSFDIFALKFGYMQWDLHSPIFKHCL